MAVYPELLFQEITDPHKRAFLAAYAKTGRITRAATSAQVNWRNHYNWLKDDAGYVVAFGVAQQMAGDFLEDEAIRRAMEGWQEPVFYKGEHVDNVQKYSDTLMIVMLKGAKPEKYRDLAVKGQVDVSGTLKVVRLPQKATSTDAWMQEHSQGGDRGTDLGTPTETH